MSGAEATDEVLIPWKDIPVSEPVLPGEFSDQFHEEKGWPVWHPALVSVVSGVMTFEAQKLLSDGRVQINGAVANQSFSYIKPGALIEVEGIGRYRVGPIEPSKYEKH